MWNGTRAEEVRERSNKLKEARKASGISDEEDAAATFVPVPWSLDAMSWGLGPGANLLFFWSNASNGAKGMSELLRIPVTNIQERCPLEVACTVREADQEHDFDALGPLVFPVDVCVTNASHRGPGEEIVKFIFQVDTTVAAKRGLTWSGQICKSFLNDGIKPGDRRHISLSATVTGPGTYDLNCFSLAIQESSSLKSAARSSKDRTNIPEGTFLVHARQKNTAV